MYLFMIFHEFFVGLVLRVEANELVYCSWLSEGNGGYKIGWVEIIPYDWSNGGGDYF